VFYLGVFPVSRLGDVLGCVSDDMRRQHWTEASGQGTEMKKQDLEDEINAFLDVWNCDAMTRFLRDIIPLFELYDVDEQDDWVEHAVGKDDERTVRLIRTVYLVSRIAEFHAGKLCDIKYRFKNLWTKMEKRGYAENASS
jgi:hypothetical protein